MPEKAQTPQKFSSKPFSRKGEGGALLIFINPLLSDPLFLRSDHGQVTKCNSLFGQERARSQAQLSPSQVPVLTERRQSSAGGHCPRTLPRCQPEGERLPTQQVPGLLRQPYSGGQVQKTACYAHAVRWQRQGCGKSNHLRVWIPVRGQPWRGLWSPAEHSPPTCFLGSPSSPAGPRPGEPEGSQEERWGPPLTSLSS